MNRHRFEALAVWARSTMARIFFSECAHWSTGDERLLGIVAYDHTDKDFGYLVLARDELQRFRAVDVATSYFTRREAELALRLRLEELASKSDEEFYQGDTNAADSLDLFVPIAPEDRRHAGFKALTTQNGFSPALGILRELANVFEDRDGNFVRDFQTTGFNARLWELYLFAALVEQGLTVHREGPSPDFLASGTSSFGVEAVTINPPDSSDEPPSQPKSPGEVWDLLQDYMPIKFSGVLHAKLGRRYWELEHMARVPLVFAVADFHAPQSMTWSGSALPVYLYGLRPEPGRSDDGNLEVEYTKVEAHDKGGTPIPSDFFSQPDTENVAAVMASNQATLSKFNRMGVLADFGDPGLRLIRRGMVYDSDPNALTPQPIAVDVDHPEYDEGWGDEIDVYHNPNALNPLDPDLLPGFTHYFLEEGRVTAYGREGVFSGSTTTILSKNKEEPPAR